MKATWMLKKVTRHDDTDVFREPVSRDVPRSYDKIKRPMDLQTMARKNDGAQPVGGEGRGEHAHVRGDGVHGEGAAGLGRAELELDLLAVKGDFGDIEHADRAEFGKYGGDISEMAAYGGSSKFKSKNVEQLEKELEKVDCKLETLNAAIKADKKHAVAAKLKAAANVDYDPSQDVEDK